MVRTVKSVAVTDGRLTPGASGPNAAMVPKSSVAAEVPEEPRVTPAGSVSNTRAIPFLWMSTALMVPVAVGFCASRAAEHRSIAAARAVRIVKAILITNLVGRSQKSDGLLQHLCRDIVFHLDPQGLGDRQS